MRKIVLLVYLIVAGFTETMAQTPILGGELSNSAATSVTDIQEVLPRMKALGLNTVLVPVYWEFLEPRG